MDLHGRIMNLPATGEPAGGSMAPYSAEPPDDAELESWRSVADDLLQHPAGCSTADLRRAAHLLQNAYSFAAKLRQTMEK